MIDLDAVSLSYFDVPAFIMEVDDEGRAVYCVFNQKWCDGTNRVSEDVVGKTAEDLFGGHLGQAAQMRHMEVIRSGEKLTYDVVIPVRDRNHNFRTTLVPIFDDTRRVTQLGGISFDRTAEAEGTAMQARLAAANADIERFILIAAHDLRTRMYNIKRIAEMLREDFEDQGDRKLELIDILATVAVKATARITDILAHAQASTAIKLEETFDVAQLSNDILVTLNPLNQHELNISCQRIRRQYR